MIAIRSRVDALASGRAQPLLQGLSSSSFCAIGVVHGSLTPDRAGRPVRSATGCGTRRRVPSSTGEGWCCGRPAPCRATGSGSCRGCRSGTVAHPSSVGQRQHRVLSGADERAAQVDRHLGDRRWSTSVRPTRSRPSNTTTWCPSRTRARAADRPGEAGAHNDDVGAGWDAHRSRLSRREGHDSVVRAAQTRSSACRTPCGRPAPPGCSPSRGRTMCSPR